ncbi:hypothetical protein X777_13688 [Ooceraea biroi]|uniref:Uncharacterized protein n=1 Tax=Ooceraea biroi TaxID=2015173 RepID=A0A026VY32_OOCBI|nr:hypothetical protein X777_13688 [Ooceraea biroi]
MAAAVAAVAAVVHPGGAEYRRAAVSGHRAKSSGIDGAMTAIDNSNRLIIRPPADARNGGRCTLPKQRYIRAASDPVSAARLACCARESASAPPVVSVCECEGQAAREWTPKRRGEERREEERRGERERERERTEQTFAASGLSARRRLGLADAIQRRENAGNVADGRYDESNDDDLAGPRLGAPHLRRRRFHRRDGGNDDRRRAAGRGVQRTRRWRGLLIRCCTSRVVGETRDFGGSVRSSADGTFPVRRRR